MKQQLEPEDKRLTNLASSERAKRNLSAPELVERSLANGESVLSNSGAICATTGKYTGRSPNDKFTVDNPASHDNIAWGKVNKAISAEAFDKLYDRVLTYLEDRDVYVFDGFVGADTDFRLPIRVINEFAWHNLFVHQLFIRPSEEELKNHKPQFTVVGAPGFKAEPERDGTNSEAFILVNFEKRVVLIGGTHYAGEMKKSLFGVMNYILPQKGVMSMHCSANIGEAGDVALFFGLSGTGKTTLSADPNRKLIGDDEHGWSDNGVFNFEGGCYAKCIRLSPVDEPQIWNALRFGSVLENVVLNDERVPDFNSDKLTENTRGAYPVDFIPGAVIPSVGGHPDVIIFLTADAFGVLPPVAKLTNEQAMYHFLSGYTSKLAGTERGVTEPQATFSACFGEPFLPLRPSKYAELLGEKINKHKSRVYLINTGWSGGPYGVGNRMKISYTRAIVSAALSGELEKTEFTADPIFKVLIPNACPGVPADVLQPRNTWSDKSAYDQKAKELANLFSNNFKKFTSVPENIASAGPVA